MKLYSLRGWLLWILILIAILLYVLGRNAYAEEKHIVFAVDVSSSVKDFEYALQKNAYVSLLSDPSTRSVLDGANIAIIEFATAAHIVIPFTNDYQSAAILYKNTERSGVAKVGVSGTNPFSAVVLGASMLAAKPGKKILDIAGDGALNQALRTVPNLWYNNTPKMLAQEGIQCNALIFGDPSERLEASIFYNTLIINGFIVEVYEQEDFIIGLKRKIVTEIASSH